MKTSNSAVKLVGIGWVELEFPAMILDKLTTWSTFGRILSMSSDTITVEYYTLDQKLVKQVFEYHQQINP